MMVLYINNEHCISIAQLKGFFSRPLSAGSTIFYDLLDCGRYGDITQWLREIGEDSIAERVESINPELTDSEYINHLGSAIMGQSIKSYEKPIFAKCVNLSISKKQSKYDSFIIELAFVVLVAVNEKYEVKLNTGWGTKVFMFNPSEFEESETYKNTFVFHKRVGKEIDEIIVSVDDCILIHDRITKEKFPDTEAAICLNKERDYPKPIYSNSCSLKQRRTIDNILKQMNLISDVDGEFCIFDGNPHKASLTSYYISQLITQNDYGVIMSQSYPYTSALRLDYNSIIGFIDKLNEMTRLQFNLPSEAQWVNAVSKNEIKGGTHEWTLDCWDPKINFQEKQNPVCLSISGNHVVRCSSKKRYGASRREQFFFRLVIINK